MIVTKVSGLNDSIYGKSFAPIKQHLVKREEMWEGGRSMIDHVFAKDTTTNFAESYTGETNIQDFDAVGENGRYPERTFQADYSKIVEPEEWKNSFSISQTMIEDAKMGKAKMRGNAFVDAYMRTKEKFGATIYTEGDQTSMAFGNKTFNIAGADGKALFATDHGSITNGYGAQTNKFDVDLTSASIYDKLSIMEDKMQNFRGPDGELLNITPDTIIIPNRGTAQDSAFKQKLFEALNADGNPTTAERSSNYHFGRWNIVVWSFLGNMAAATVPYMIMLSKQYMEDYMAMVWLQRLELSVKSYVDENTDANIWKGRARFGAAPVDWRYAAVAFDGSGGTAI